MKRRISRVPCYKGGFSLPEVLVALTILTVVVTVLTRVHVGTLRAGSMARGLDAAVTELGNVSALSLLGENEESIIQSSEANGWVARLEPAGFMEGGGGWKAWSVSSSNRPAPRVSVYVRGRPESAGGGAEQGEDGK